jgi:hypothetical protein
VRGIETDADGAVFVPIVDPNALAKLRLAQKVDGQAMSAKDLESLHERIQLLAFVARAQVVVDVEPQSYFECLRSTHWPAWRKEMQLEMDNMDLFKVF